MSFSLRDKFIYVRILFFCHNVIFFSKAATNSCFRTNIAARGYWFCDLWALPCRKSVTTSSLLAFPRVFTHLRCRDLPINHCNSACPAPSRAIRVRICISDYTGRAGVNGPRAIEAIGARGDPMHKYVTSHRCFAFPSNWPRNRFCRLEHGNGNQISPRSLPRAVFYGIVKPSPAFIER